MDKIPGLVTDIHDHDKSVVEVKCKNETIKAQNMLSHLKLGDYVIVHNGIIIEIISEKHAEELMRHH